MNRSGAWIRLGQRVSRRANWLFLAGWLSLTAAGGGAQEAGNAASVESSPAALAVYADAANFQNNSAFALAVDEWSKFLERFPDDPLAAKARHYRGICQLQLNRWADAVASFESVVQQHPKFEQLEQTLLHLGWCQYSLARAGDQSQYAAAADTFGRLIQDYPQSEDIDQAIFFSGESLYAMDRKKEAATAYERLVTDFPESALRSEGLYAWGVTLEEMGDFARAMDAHDQFLQEFTSSELATEVRMRKAEALLQTGDAAGAEKLFAEVASRDGFPAADHALLRQAYCAASQDRDADAAAIYVSLAERFPHSRYFAAAQLSAGRCFYRADQLEDAAAWFQKSIATGGSPVSEAAHWLCRIYLRQDQPAKVLDLVARVLPQNENQPFAAHLQLDRADALYATEGRRPEALQEYLAVLRSHPDQEIAPDALYGAAFTALDLQQYDQALELANQFVSTYAEHRLAPDASGLVAECQLQRKQFPEAEATYRALLEHHPQHPEVPTWRNRLGWTLHLQGNHQPAIDLLAPQLVDEEPAAIQAEAAYLIGISEFQLRRFAEAAKSLRASILADPKWREADATLLYLARAQYQLEQWDQAQATLTSLQETFPDSPQLEQAAYRLGECLYAAGDYEAAAAAYQRLLETWPATSYADFALYGKGWAEMKAQRYELADASFSTLLDRDAAPALQADTLFARGMCRRQLGHHSAAVADIQQYLATNPDGPPRADALYERGLAEMGADQHQQAAASFALLLDEQPDYTHADKVLYELAWSYKSLDDTTRATETFDRLAERFPDSPLAAEARFHLAESLYAAADYVRASGLYRQAIAGTEDAELGEKARYKLGWSFFQQDEFQQALESFSQQLEQFPRGSLRPDARFMKAESLFKLKQFEAAHSAFEESRQDKSPTPEIEAIKLLHSSQAAAQLGKWREGRELLDQLISDYPQTGYLAEAYFERGQAHRKLNVLDQAVADFRQAAERSRGELGARSLFMIGELAFQNKQYDEAIKDFQRVMFRFVPSDTDPEVARWQARAAYEAGRCAEVQVESAKTRPTQQKRLAEARRFYRYLIEKHPQSELAPEARQRLAALEQL